MSTIRNIIGAVLMTGAVATTPSCVRQEVYDTINSREAVLSELMDSRPQSELDEIHRTIHSGPFTKPAELQRKVDVIAFQDMFKGSQLAQDSQFVADYNKMIAATNVPIERSGVDGGFVVSQSKMKQTLRNMVSVGEFKKLEKNPLLPQNGAITEAGLQYTIDSTAHYKFFEQKGLLDSVGKKNFRTICRKIRP